MTPSYAQRILERLGEWLDWYGDEGYLNDRPTANYYWGYLTALSFAGLAFAGEAPAADAWLKQARRELAENVLPAFRDDLAGGGWPEGSNTANTRARRSRSSPRPFAPARRSTSQARCLGSPTP